MSAAELCRSLVSSVRLPGGRIVINNAEFIDFSSNDYLGLASNDRISLGSNESGFFGSGGSRLLGGNSPLMSRFEFEFSEWLGTESALLFNSGYHANLGVIPALFGDRDIIFADKYVHASLIDGIRLSRSRMIRFAHNDMTHLRELMVKHRNAGDNALIVVESLYSMDGDFADLDPVRILASEFDCALMIDESHALGMCGAGGRGLAINRQGISDREIWVGGLGKAWGGLGGMVAGSSVLCNYLINTARSLIYSTALPEPVVARNQRVLVEMPYLESRRVFVTELASWFRSQLVSDGWKVFGNSHIVPVILGNVQEAVSLSKFLKQNGIWAPAIKPPTVPKNAARIRFSVTAAHSKVELMRVLESLNRWRKCNE